MSLPDGTHACPYADLVTRKCYLINREGHCDGISENCDLSEKEWNDAEHLRVRAKAIYEDSIRTYRRYTNVWWRKLLRKIGWSIAKAGEYKGKRRIIYQSEILKEIHRQGNR